MNPSAQRWSGMHWPLLGLVVAIAMLGVYNLHSAAAAREPSLYLTQLVWIVLGVGVAALVMLPDYRATEGLAYAVYGIVCLLLLAVLLQGKSAGGAQRWLVIGPLTFQPSELAKLAVIFCLARYFSYRVGEQGYTFGELVRPLNPSRPLTAIVMLAIYWRKPWVLDPFGELARFVADKAVPPPGDLLWFRVGLILAIVLLAAFGYLAIRALEMRSQLLNPWPPTRRRRLLLLLLLLAVSAGVGLYQAWDHPFIKDPFGVWLASLQAAAAPGGAHEILVARVGLRLLLTLGAVIYAAGSLLYLRHRGATMDVLVAPFDLLVLPALLVLVEPDLGTAGVIFLIGFTMILMVGVRLRSLLTMGVLGAMTAAVAWFGVLKDYQRRRILTFIDPEHDIQGAGWNAIQSLIAVGSGRWWGKGHLQGTQSQLSFLPEQHTDFAFSVWAEEQGFVGCMVVLVLYFAVVTVALRIAAEARDTYGSLLAAGVAALVLWHTLINVGMVIGVMPVVGLTLPLFSYGGSSLLTMMLGIGVLLNVYWRRRAH